jgi:type I restriction enzyme S subunit
MKNGCKPNLGDLLFSKDGTVGKVSLVDFEKDFVVLSSLAIIRPKSKIITSSLLKYILKNPLFLQTAVGMKTGVAIRRIILKNLKLIDVSFPKSLKDQNNIVQKLDALSAETKKLEAIYQQKSVDLEELKKSVLQKAFNGEL